MSKVLVDTGPIIQALRQHKPTVQLLRGLASRDHIVISIITRLEIYAGMQNEERYATQKFLSRFIAYDLNRSIAERAGTLIATYHRIGYTLGVSDAIIAATAINYQIPLLTFNTNGIGNRNMVFLRKTILP